MTRHPTTHLGMQVSAYVDRRLDAPTLHAFDQHLVTCLVCRYAADEERRILTSLRSGPTPGFSADLQSMLLALASSAPEPDALPPSAAPGSRPPRRRGAAVVPPIPAAPDAVRQSVRQLRVPTVPPAAPAMHRSPRRAAAVATFAAGASAAAAIGLAMVGPGSGAAATVRPTSPQAPGTASVSVVPASFSGSAFQPSPLRQVLQRPGR